MSSTSTDDHIGDLALRRRRAGEPLGPDAAAIEAHAAACAECRARARALDDEQRRFEQRISFDRFAAGVERAARGAAARRRTGWMPRLWMAPPLVAMAAAVALVVTFKPHDTNRTRTKGGAGITVRVAGAAGQRDARVDGTERLAPGERLRVGYQPEGHRYLLSLAIDDKGQVTPLYPERGASLTVPDDGAPGSATRYLPESVELTGAGLERIVVVLSDQPIAVEAAARAARAAFDKAGGDLARLPRLTLTGEQFSRTFAKP
jgi:hypothetical protein